MINPILDAKEAAAALVDAAFQRAVAAGELPDAPLPAYVVEIPADITHGDFAANAAMVGAKALRRAPRQIAQAICGHLEL